MNDGREACIRKEAVLDAAKDDGSDEAWQDDPPKADPHTTFRQRDWDGPFAGCLPRVLEVYSRHVANPPPRRSNSILVLLHPVYVCCLA